MKYTAHIRSTDKKEQSVEEHCKRTARLASEYAKTTGLEKAAKSAGVLHDIGKLSSVFNSYIHGDNSYKRGDIDHSFAGARYLKELSVQSGDKNMNKAFSLIGRVILAHHGLRDWVNDDSEDIYDIRTKKESYYAEILENFQSSELSRKVNQELIEAAREVTSVRSELRKISDNKEKFAFYLGMMERFLLSCLIDADRTDTADFMSDSETETEFDTKQLWKDMQNRLNEKLNRFSSRTDDISIQRRSISDRCFEYASNEVRICKLIVPTGGGKTLSSLRFAIEYAKQHDLKKIMYIAPFMSILEQNSDEIRSIAGEEAFLEHHSDMLADIADNDEKLNEYELRTEKWDSPVIATTMVQFLNSLFSGKTSSINGANLFNLSSASIISSIVKSE